MDRLVAFLKSLLIGVLVAAACVYAGDTLITRLKISGSSAANGFVETSKVRRLYAIPKKNGKDDFSIGDPETEMCIHSLFPHFGYEPCWYTHRQDKKPVFL